jgi:hypothetical protein
MHHLGSSSFQCRGRAERTARVVRMVPGPAFLANEFDILFEVRFHSRTHVSSDPSYPSLFARGDLFSHRCDTGTLTRLVLHLPLPPFPSVIQSTKNFLAPLRSAVESIVPADSAHYWILLVTLLVCPALILYGHHVETRYVSFYLFTYGQLY